MPRLLREWARSGATGTLTLTGEPPFDDVCTVLVQDGSVVFATRRSQRDPTGELFLELFEIPSYGFDEDDEVDIVRSQITRVVTDLFNRTSAEIDFHPEISLTRWPSLRLPLADLMRCGMLAVADTGHVRDLLGDTGRRFERTDDPFGLFLLPRDEQEDAVLSLMDSPRTLDELVETSGVTEELVVRLLAALVIGEAVTELPDATEVAAAPEADLDVAASFVVEAPVAEAEAEPVVVIVESSPEAEAAGDAVSEAETEPEVEVEATADSEAEVDQDLDPVFDPHETAKFWYEAEEKARAVRDGRDFYALLEVDRRSNTDAICAGYRLLATHFHPDRNSRFAPRDDEGRTQLDVIFDALTTAFAILTKPAFREAYDVELARLERERALPVNTAPLAKSVSAPLPIPSEFVTKPLVPIEPAARPEAEPPDTKPQARAATNGDLSAAEWYRRGEAFEAAGDHVRAAQAYERCVAIGPDRSKVFLALGRTLARGSDGADRAEDALLKAVTLAPFSAACYVALGDLYARLGRHGEAKEQFTRALSINANDADATAALASLEKPGPSLIRRLFNS